MAKLEIKETLGILLKLQDIDSKIAELEVSKVFYPKLLENLRNEIDSLSEQVKNTKTNISELKKTIDLKNLELEQNKEKLTQGQQRLLSVKSNKEYDAVQREIQNSEENIAQLEVELISLMEDLERAEADEKKLTEELSTKEKGNAIQIEEMEKQYSAIEGKSAEIQSKRNTYAELIDKKILDTYERIAEGTNGFGVVKVVHRACGGCFQSLPAKFCQAIRRHDTINYCETCGRILVWDDECSG
ncbi:hypothetical protein KAH81_09085 [bacterium]|nr:hypothetical protein [bacterium]